jgi:hypothetical protein
MIGEQHTGPNNYEVVHAVRFWILTRQKDLLVSGQSWIMEAPLKITNTTEPAMIGLCRAISAVRLTLRGG